MDGDPASTETNDPQWRRALEIGRRFNRCRAVSDVVHTAVEAGIQLTGASACYVALIDESTPNRLRVTRMTSDSPAVEQLDVPLDADLPLARAARLQDILLVESNEALERLRCDDPELSRLDPADHACASVPLRVSGRPVGAMNFAFTEPRSFAQEELELIELLADYVAQSADRAFAHDRNAVLARATLALRNVTDGVLLVDADEVIRIWTPAAVRITGISEERAVGKHVAEVLDDWHRLLRYVPVSDAGGVREERRADPVPIALPGGERWMVIRGVRVEGSTIYTFRDATDERSRDQQLLDYVATASHQLRTPIAAISGAALTLERDDIELDEASEQAFLRMIIEGADRLVATVDAILHASRLQGEYIPKAVEVPSVLELVEGIVASVDVTADHRLVIDVPEQLRVVTDRQALDVVLTNLVENAVKYSPQGGTITVRARRQGRELRVEVEDEGIGISEAELPRIFDKFHRADPDMRQGIAGTGLGLYISNEMVTRAGGTLAVRAAPGAGSTFTVVMPATGLRTGADLQRMRAGDRERARSALRGDAAVGRMLRAVQRFDALSIHDELSHLFARFGRSLVSQDVIVPLLRVIGGSADPDAASIAREHLVANVVRGRLWAGARGWETIGAPRMVVACGPREEHDLGLLMFAVAASELGWAVTWLGARTPLESLRFAVEQVQPRCVVVAGVSGGALTGEELGELEQIAERIPVWVGGGSADADLHHHPGLRPLPDEPLEAASHEWFLEQLLDRPVTTAASAKP